jgi:hypothetical protein
MKILPASLKITMRRHAKNMLRKYSKGMGKKENGGEGQT